MADHMRELLYQVSDLIARFRKARSELAQLPKRKVQLEAVVIKRNRKEAAIQSKATAGQTEKQGRALQRRIAKIPEAAEVVRLHKRIQSVLYKVPELHQEMNLLLSRVKAASDELAPYVLEVRGVPQEPEIANLDSIIVLLEDMLRAPYAQRFVDRLERKGDFSKPQSAYQQPARPAHIPQPEPTAAQDQTLSEAAQRAATRDVKLLQKADGSFYESVDFPTAERYADISDRRRQQLMTEGILGVVGKGQNRRITVKSLMAYCPPTEDPK
jgi:hypothetical protein